MDQVTGNAFALQRWHLSRHVNPVYNWKPKLGDINPMGLLRRISRSNFIGLIYQPGLFCQLVNVEPLLVRNTCLTCLHEIWRGTQSELRISLWEIALNQTQLPGISWGRHSPNDIHGTGKIKPSLEYRRSFLGEPRSNEVRGLNERLRHILWAFLSRLTVIPQVWVKLEDGIHWKREKKNVDAHKVWFDFDWETC